LNGRTGVKRLAEGFTERCYAICVVPLNTLASNPGKGSDDFGEINEESKKCLMQDHNHGYALTTAESLAS
ncbi:hypothetical protein Tco_0062777, partial [Tanacetum coccineum]